MMGEPAAHLTVNGTKRQSHGHVPRPGRALPQQFWAGFWTERLEALKRHIENAQAGADPRPTSGQPRT